MIRFEFLKFGDNVMCSKKAYGASTYRKKKIPHLIATQLPNNNNNKLG